MISVITYGRNDNYGYGMTKRVAISLNALATQIDESTGELIFVDYNTAAHLPTLPELIRDTLTEQTRRRLRVLRVRPKAHARYARTTYLPVLEPVARNVALRRSNQNNPWILSTNTDALVLPFRAESLIAFARTLSTGAYGLPRFELPERAWETFDRSDPQACFDMTRSWAHVARLAEIVRGVSEVRYDNPGDFQLFPRATALEIGGFDERMRFGWHVDHNMAKRLSMSLGPIIGLDEHFELYHLGHARNAVATHSHDRIENDARRFVTEVRNIVANENEDWGLAGEEIDEISVDASPAMRLRAIASSILKPAPEQPPTTHYSPIGYDDFRYDAGRVAAHLYDLVSPLSAKTVFCYSGVRRDLLSFFQRGLRELGFSTPILVPASLKARLDRDEVGDVRFVEDEQAFEEADWLIFEFGLSRDEIDEQSIENAPRIPTADEVDALEAVAHCLVQAERNERKKIKEGSMARQFVLINTAHNRYERRFSGVIAASAAPFSTRLRYGTLLNPPAPSRGQTSTADLVRAHESLSRLTSPEGLDRDVMFQVAASAGIVRQLLSDPETTEEFAELLDLARSRLSEATRIEDDLATLALPQTTDHTPFGLARVDAWDNPAWRIHAERFGQNRDGWRWERACLMEVTSKYYDDHPNGRILAVAEHNDPIFEFLAALGQPIDLLDARVLFGADPSADLKPSSRAIQRVGFNDLTKQRYSVIVAPHAGLMRRGVVGLADAFSLLARLLLPGGLLAMAGEVALLGPAKASRPTLDVASPQGFPKLLRQHLGLELVSDSGWGIRRDDLALVGTPSDLSVGRPIFGLRKDDDVTWPAVWVFRASNPPMTVDPQALASDISGLLLGEQRDALRVGVGAVRKPEGIVVNACDGHVVFGPYLWLIPGKYKATFNLCKISGAQSGRRGRRRIVVEVVLNNGTVCQKEIGSWQGPEASINLTFDVRGLGASCELRIGSSVNSSFLVKSVAIERLAGLRKNKRSGFLALMERGLCFARVRASDKPSCI